MIPIGSFYPCSSGGPAISMYAMVRELTRLKLFKFKIITTSIGYKDIGDPELLKLDIEYLDDKSIKFPIKLILRSIQILSKYDIIHLNSLYDWPSIILFLFAKIFIYCFLYQ